MDDSQLNTVVTFTLFEDEPGSRAKVVEVLSSLGFKDSVPNKLSRPPGWQIWALPTNTMLGTCRESASVLRDQLLRELDGLVKVLFVGRLDAWALKAWDSY